MNIFKNLTKMTRELDIGGAIMEEIYDEKRECTASEGKKSFVVVCNVRQ